MLYFDALLVYELTAMDEPSDLEELTLMQRIAGGDASALNALHKKTSGILYKMALKIMYSVPEAEEVVQDVFMSVWKNAGKFDSKKAKVLTWMTVIMKNRCIDKIRARKRRIPAGFSDENASHHAFPVEKETAVNAMESKEQAEMLRSVVKSLPSAQREVVELAFFSDMTHMQVAELLGISLGTVKSRIRYAFEKMRSMIPSRKGNT